MDPISQGALGAALAGSAASRRGSERLAPALLLGVLSGMAPDLDVLIRSSTDPLLFLEYHRQFSHSLAFAPVGALVCAGLLHRLVRRWPMFRSRKANVPRRDASELRFRETYLFCLFGFASHGLLDACTSYGTMLLWPFSDARVAWNVISVIDPLFTVPLLTLLVWGLLGKRPGLARGAMSWALVYLCVGVIQGWRAERAGEALAEARLHEPSRLLVKPSFGNLLVWKVVYAADELFHVDAARVGLVPSYFPGTSIPSLDVDRALPWLAAGSRHAADLERFRRFSDGYLAPAPDREDAVIDMRYSLIPNEVDPLWGILLDRERQEAHVDFFTDRGTSRADRGALLRMLRGPGLSLEAAR